MIGFYIFTAAIVTFVLIAILHNLRQEKKIAKRKRLFESEVQNKSKGIADAYKKKQNEILLSERERLANQKLQVEANRKDKEQKKIEADRKVELQNNQRYKTDWEDYRNIISENNIRTLYHFTDRANIQSIQRHGALYSWHYCSINQIEIPFPGGDDLSRSLDSRRGVQNYVRVCFTTSHPMLFIALNQGRIKNPVLLEIDTEVIYWKNAKYANKNANRKDVNIGSTLDDFKKIRFDLVRLRNHFDLNDGDKPFYQAEILLLEKIPIEFIKNIN